MTLIKIRGRIAQKGVLDGAGVSWKDGAGMRAERGEKR